MKWVVKPHVVIEQKLEDTPGRVPYTRYLTGVLRALNGRDYDHTEPERPPLEVTQRAEGVVVMVVVVVVLQMDGKTPNAAANGR